MRQKARQIGLPVLLVAASVMIHASAARAQSGGGTITLCVTRSDNDGDDGKLRLPTAKKPCNPRTETTLTINQGGGTPGPAGPPGPQGVAGPVGPTGAVGPQGSVGPAGATGAAGAQGSVGPTGATGAAGAQGSTGPAGAAGAQGAQGTAGPTGATGASGATGAQGTQGTAGPTGATGAAGAQGSAGPAGAAGAAGAQGPAGDPGATGPAGPEGQAGSATNPIDAWVTNYMRAQGLFPAGSYVRVLTSFGGPPACFLVNGTAQLSFNQTSLLVGDASEIVHGNLNAMQVSWYNGNNGQGGSSVSPFTQEQINAWCSASATFVLSP